MGPDDGPRADAPDAPGTVGSVAGAAVSLAARAARAYWTVSWSLARRLPGAAAVEEGWSRLEQAALAELRRRLEEVDAPGPPPVRALRAGPAEPGPAPDATVAPATASATPATSTPDHPPTGQAEPLHTAMAELLLRSMEQTARHAREHLYLAVVRQLLPDEARILAALADGTPYPAVHVERRTGVSTTERLLANASSVGRAAGVAEPRDVPRYVTRLRALDLVVLDEPLPELETAFEILLTDPAVRAAERAAREGGRPRFVRRTLRISPLGRELWAACHPREAVDASWAADPAPRRNGRAPH